MAALHPDVTWLALARRWHPALPAPALSSLPTSLLAASPDLLLSPTAAFVLPALPDPDPAFRAAIEPLLLAI